MTTKVYVAFKGGVAMLVIETDQSFVRQVITGDQIDYYVGLGREYDWDENDWNDWDESIWTSTEAEDVPRPLRDQRLDLGALDFEDDSGRYKQPTDSWKWNRVSQYRYNGRHQVHGIPKSVLTRVDRRQQEMDEEWERQREMEMVYLDSRRDKILCPYQDDDMSWLQVEDGDIFNMGALEWVWRSEGSDRADELMIETGRLAQEVQERIQELKDEMDGPPVLLRAETEVFISAVRERIEMLEDEMAKPSVVWPKLMVVG